MMAETNALLARELGRLGGPGAGWVAKFLPANVCERAFRVNCTAAAARQAIEEVLSQLGQIEAEPLGGPESISIVVGSGFGGLNPAIVTVWVVASDGSTEIRVRGVAKEGLIKQRGGEQAAVKIADKLASILSEVPGG